MQHVELAELTPELLPFLGMAARLQLYAFEALAAVAAAAPGLEAKVAVSSAAGAALTRHAGLVEEIRRRDDDPIEAMRPYADAVAAFAAQVAGSDWREDLLSAYVVFGLLDDFFLHLAAGLPGEFGERSARLLHEDAGERALAVVLQREIGADPRLADVLALWGRRLVGDTLLMARSVLSSGPGATDERIEPVLTEIIAAHTRRMDALGLTA